MAEASILAVDGAEILAPHSKFKTLRKSTVSWMHRKTAEVVHDYEPLEVPGEPTLRTTARCFVTALAFIVAIIIITVVYHNSVNSRTVRHWGSAYLLTLPTQDQNYPNLLCPCNKSSIPWPYFISFYWINQTAGETSSWTRYPISNYTELCDPLIVVINGTSGAWRDACLNMALSITAYTNITMRTTISTNTVTAPSVLGHIISIQMQDAVGDVFANYAYLATNQVGDWEQLLLVKQMFNRAAYRLVMSTKLMNDENYTNDFYWRFFKGDFYTNPIDGGQVKAFDLTGQRALVLVMNWTVYVNQCRPSYCDQVVRNSLLRRFLVAITEVGGFAAVMMVLLRGIVWPCIRYLYGWS